MYNIYYSMKDAGWEGVEFVTNVNTVIKAFMCAVSEIRTVLMSTKVEFLVVGEMEFVIWAFGTCKGFLSIKKVGPVISEQGLEGG